MTDHPDNDPGQTRPFAAILQEIRAGEVADQAAALMQDLVAAVREHGKKGELTLKIVVEPMKGNEDALAVSGDVTLKAPKAPPRAAIFFADDSGNLLRDDPRQIALPGLRRVDLPTNQPKDLAQ
ncbi:hypothetical protein ACIBKY_53425 [Nonomuraea sp. NPDC050394]|uniref:hypothetical protein n=1 Tax=Nonomuraea sp. NPDC050394 TaxID=3364363 RepID=UPI00379DF22E